MRYKILAINPGSTSTKLAVFEDDFCVLRENLKHDIPASKRRDIPGQLDMRTEHVRRFLDAAGLEIRDFDIISARCGQIPNAPSQIYKVNKLMRDVVTYAPADDHASSIACLIAGRLAEGTNIPIIAPDPPTADEMDGIARVSGVPELPFGPGGHTLNCKQVCREISKKLGISIESGRFIVAHLGGGSSVSAVRGGLIVDVACNSTGPMSAERCGSLPVRQLVELCYSGEYTLEEMNAKLFSRSGFYGYTGSSDALETERRAKSGDRLSAKIYEAMAYQVAKAIGSFFAVLAGRVDAIIITGSLAHSKYLTEKILKYTGSLAAVEIIPGEREMEALAGAALRVLRGEARPVVYDLIPPQFTDVYDFYRQAAPEEQNEYSLA